MKKLLLIVSLLSLNIVFAEEAVNHDAHHPKADAKAETKAEMKSDMKMDMSEMEGMMGQCMEKNKDNKMCKHEMMKSCMEKMGKKDCAKMMKNMKGHNMNMEGHDMNSMKK